MAEGLYGQVSKAWKKPKQNLGEIYRSRLIQMRREPSIIRVDRPTRINRARSLGYKAKLGYIVSRVKIGRGGRRRKLYGRGGRKPSKAGLVNFTHTKSLQKIAEERALRRYINTFVLGSYLVGADGKHKWFEVVMADTQHPNIRNDPKARWMSSPASRKRAFR